ncbi:hypothetical protein MPSEU_000506500 [Mayamaea pseudoterrestris]|nr:hypothetical protein MPSEU_000506500 [Mayamaea pseudoterrestris]
MWNHAACTIIGILLSLNVAHGWSCSSKFGTKHSKIDVAISREFHATTVQSTTRLASTRSFVLDDDYEEYGQASSSSSYESPSDPSDTYSMSDSDLEAHMGPWDEGVAKFNTIHLTGRIGNDPEPRYFDDGKVVVNLSLATKRKYHSLERQASNLQWGQEETDWYALEIWGSTAEFVSKYVDRGTHVSVIGSLQIDEWTDRATGELRNKAKIIVRDFDILESKDEAEARRSRSGNSGGKSYNDRSDGGPSSAGSGDFF